MSSNTDSPAPAAKAAKVLACAPCSSRKIRCDRTFPCLHCVKSRIECTPGVLSRRRPRKPRFSERELLNRLHKYEELLRQHGIPLDEPYRQPAGHDERQDRSKEDDDMNQPEIPTPSTTATRSEKDDQASNLFRRHTRTPSDSDHSQEDDNAVPVAAIKNAWEQSAEFADHLLFSSSQTAIDIASLHPDPLQIFRLWQVYLDNVNPLLKITHTPSLQSRIIDAATHLTTVDAVLEALMFSIYCVAIFSLAPADCKTMLGSSREDLLARYQFACQQALFKCAFLRTTERDCLTALLFYLISIRADTVPQSLHSMLGVALRIAQRMGIHDETALAQCSVFEAEMRRRLWWALMLLDTRIAQLSSSNATLLDASWDCKIPLNLNDSGIRPDMKELPAGYEQATESIFFRVRYEIADHIRHTEFRLYYTTTLIKHSARHLHDVLPQGDSELDKLDQMIESKYLNSLVTSNPLHFMTLWVTRSHLAKCHLLDYMSKLPTSGARWSDSQRDLVLFYALEMLEGDSKVMKSPLTAGYRWFNHFYFPFLAYINIVQDLKQRPLGVQAQRCWNAMDENYHPWFEALAEGGYSPVMGLFCRVILEAWDICKAAAGGAGQELATPSIVTTLGALVAQLEGHAPANQAPAQAQAGVNMNAGIDDFSPMPNTDFNFGSNNQGPMYHMGTPTSTASGSAMMTSPLLMSENQTQGAMDLYIRNQLEWTAMGGWSGWSGF